MRCSRSGSASSRSGCERCTSIWGIPYAAEDGDAPATTDENPFSGSGAAPSNGSDLPAEVVDLAHAGHTTEAISRLRDLTGMTLLEAKRAVEGLDGA